MRPTLRSRLARDVLLPLALVWGIGSIVVLAVSNHFTAQAFDRSLLDDAYALAAHVRQDGGRLVLQLSAQEMSTLLFDQSESIAFALWGADGTLLNGDARLRPDPAPTGSAYGFADAALAGEPVRRVTLRRDDPAFTVVMAQTTAGRTALLRRLLVWSALVQLALLVALAGWLRRSIARDLGPLGDLQRTLDARDAADLAPLPAALADGAATRDVQHLGLALNALFTRLQQSLTAQREFAGNVAHELRTPLAGIRAQASCALAQPDPAVWRSELEGIAAAEQRASRLVDQLLALARAGEGSAGLRLEALELGALVREVLLRHLAKAKPLGVDLGAENLDAALPVQGDRALLEGILNNLIDNALRHGRGAPPRVTVALRREGAVAVLSVSDNGPGLADIGDAAPTQRWTQGARGRVAGEGAGLGLAIVARYAELLEAPLGFDDAGPGLRVSVRLRLAPGTAPGPAT